MKKSALALALLLASTTSNALVLKCRYPNSNSFVTTTAQFCPNGTYFEKMMEGNDTQAAANIESQPRYVNAPVNCDVLRQWKNHYERLLKNNSSEPDLLTKFRDASNAMTENGCRL